MIEANMATIIGQHIMKRSYLIYVFMLTLTLLFAFITTPAYAETYTYDTTGRLTQVAYDDGSTITYSYDNNGNLLKRAVSVTMTLADVIRVLQVFAQIDSSLPVYQKMDVNGDGQIELGELIYILQKVSGLRQ